MRPSTLFTPLLALTFTTLVASEACVAGGPASAIDLAKKCCYAQSGTWYQFYPVQAICAFDDWRTYAYKACIQRIPDALLQLLDSTCIPGSGPTGPTGPGFVTSTSTGRITFTAPLAAATSAA